MPELKEEVGAITEITDGNRHELLTSSKAEAVAKFSSFRQLRVSSFQRISAVTPVTPARDGGQ
jgi:hypothetical protein